MLIGPLGTLARVWLGATLNPYAETVGFPFGTFVANMGACALLYALYLGQTQALDAWPCAVVEAGIVGVCGCLSTISTFVVELYALPLRNAYAYALLSILVSQALGVVMLGSYNWSGHDLTARCMPVIA